MGNDKLLNYIAVLFDLYNKTIKDFLKAVWLQLFFCNKGNIKLAKLFVYKFYWIKAMLKQK